MMTIIPVVWVDDLILHRIFMLYFTRILYLFFRNSLRIHRSHVHSHFCKDNPLSVGACYFFIIKV